MRLVAAVPPKLESGRISSESNSPSIRHAFSTAETRIRRPLSLPSCPGPLRSKVLIANKSTPSVRGVLTIRRSVGMASDEHAKGPRSAASHASYGVRRFIYVLLAHAEFVYDCCTLHRD